MGYLSCIATLDFMCVTELLSHRRGCQIDDLMVYLRWKTTANINSNFERIIQPWLQDSEIFEWLLWTLNPT